jgi:hypothetical protein
VSCKNEAVLLLILKIKENVSKTSIRQLSQQMNLFVGTMHTMLHKNLHPYRVTAGIEPNRLLYKKITSLQLACRQRSQ